MVYQPPTGARDLLPLEVAQKHWIEDRLEQVFRRWGYHPIITSTVEHLDTLMAGGAIDRNAVIELNHPSDQRLGLRPELTASIARIAVSRLAQVTYPQRLYYHANVFRRNGLGQQELYQSGVELLGAAAPLADMEILLLLNDCLASLNLPSWSLVLGDAQITRALLDPFPPSLRNPVRRALAQLDRVALGEMGLPPDLYDRALFLLDLRGEPETILATLAQPDLDLVPLAAIAPLRQVVDLLRQGAFSTPSESAVQPQLILDLSLIQTFDYYTGLVFEVVSSPELGCQVLGQGGRYDNLLGLFHSEGKSFPGIGYVLNSEVLQKCLGSGGGLPQRAPASDWLVVPTDHQAVAAAFSYAQKLRHSASLVRAEVHLGEFISRPALRNVAQTRGITRIAWIEADGLPDIEVIGQASRQV
ncbi:MAG: ATP phosphoribosyltransferase regulatory subunit [Cyanobacteriota bacterium]|nr:ATP phosphoribosyltransferase regulatory subunit [Cyanobacteriota bacterium]